MKKLLLFVCVAFTAMTASAQKEAFSTTKLASNNQKMTSMVATTANVNNAVAAAPALDALAGNYTEVVLDGELLTGTPATVSIDGENVVMSFADGYVTDVKGTYDAATGVVNIGAQPCGSYTDSRGTFEFTVMGIEELDLDAGKLYTTDDLSFTVSDDGNMDCNQPGYFIKITKFTAAAGSDYEDGFYDGKTWTWYEAPRFIQVNAVQAGYTNGRNTGNTWAEFRYPVAVEDYEYSVNVYGYANLACLSIDINEDGTVSIPMGQPMVDLGLTDQADIDTYGAYLCVYGVDLTDDNYMHSNTDKEVTTGTIAGNTITITEYTRINSKFDEGGSGYAQNWYADGMTITLNEGNYKIFGTTGIEEVTTTLEERAKNSKTYNLMGQRVNQVTAKGLLIRDGKKYIKNY